MAFGIDRKELKEWKDQVVQGEIAYLTHYWLDDRFPGCDTVTKAGCRNIDKLIRWGEQYGLQKEWIHYRGKYPHFDLFGAKQKEILISEGKWSHIRKFNL